MSGPVGTVDAYASRAAEDNRLGPVRSASPRIPAKTPYWQQQQR
jgi:hypothetical protein